MVYSGRIDYGAEPHCGPAYDLVGDDQRFVASKYVAVQ